MASADVSTDSTDHYRGRSSLKSSRHRKKAPNQVEHLAGTLQDTNRNLRVVDKMLEQYKDMGDQQSTAMDRLKDDLARTTGQLRDEKIRQSSRERSSRSRTTRDLDGDYNRGRQRKHRGPTSPLRDYRHDHEKSFSDREYGDYEDRRHRAKNSTIRFHDDMDAGHHLHDLHQSVRDIGSGQIRIEDDLQREIDRRNIYEHKNKQGDGIPGAIGTAISSVDLRLQSIQDELRSERTAMKKRQEEVGHVSEELRHALETQKVQGSKSTSDEMELKNRLSQAQTFNHTIEELRKQLSRSEDERQHLRQKLLQLNEELQSRNNRRQGEEHDREQHENDRRHLENELRELRTQLGKSAVVVGDYADLRRELERSEKQRDQLSDHLQVLNKEVEAKEKQSAKVITQLQDCNEKLEELERGRRQVLMELETTLRKLQDVTNVADTSTRDLHETQQKLKDNEQRKEEIKARAQETVRQWKLKCKKLERDADRFKHSGDQSANRSEQLVRELEALRSQHGTSAQQLDHLKRELNELLGIRAQQDEQVRIKDVEVNELRSFRLDMDKELRDCKSVMERMEHELHSAREKVASVNEERSRLEEQIANMQSSQMLMQKQGAQLQQEVRELSIVKVEMSAQLADAANQKQELRVGLQEARQAESVAKQDMETQMKRGQEEKDFYTKKIDSLQTELDHYRSHESHKVKELSRLMKKSQAEYQAELQAMKLQLDEERSSNKIMRKQQDKLQVEIDRVNVELARSQEDKTGLERKYQKVKEEYISKSQVTEDGISRAREVELELLDNKELLNKIRKDYQNLLHLVAGEVDAVVEVVTADTIDSYKTLAVINGLTTDPQRWLAEIQSKLDWVKSEIRQHRAETKRLRLDVRDAVIGSEHDRQVLVEQLERQNTALDQMNRSMNDDVAAESESFQLKQDREPEIIQLPSPVLTDLEPVKLSTSSHTSDVAQLQSDNERLVKETQLEREKINDRYNKLQETMSLLKQELTQTKLRADLTKSCLSNSPRKSCSTTPTKSPRRVRITSPPVRSTSPSPTRHATRARSRTPPPLALSDEEFLAQFVPKSPKINVQRELMTTSVQ